MIESRILYVTADGLLQPLGYSQIFRVVRALALRGFRYHVVSLERDIDIADADRVAHLRTELSSVAVTWSPIRYLEGGGGHSARNLAALAAAATRSAARERPTLVHARAYHGAATACVVQAARGTPFLFDARGYWIDERREAGQWFTTRTSHALARRAERALYRRAAGAVTLTALQAADLLGGRFGAWSDRPLAVIPTCADFDAFRPGGSDRRSNLPIPPTALAIGFVGSVNASYRTDRAIALAKRVVALRADAMVVGLSESPQVYAELFSRAGIPPDRWIAKRVEHSAIPEWIAAIDWGVLVLKESPAKRASMPTKLAEFLAAGVAPIHHGCNSEVADWVRRSQLGLTLPSLDDDVLETAARQIAGSTRSHEAIAHARSVAEDHFSLAAGVARYEAILHSLHDGAVRPRGTARATTRGDALG